MSPSSLQKAKLSAAILAVSSCALSGTAVAQNQSDSLRGRATLEEVVVTAQRRQENLQEVPISVASFGADALDNVGIDTTLNLPEIAPSVQLVRSGPVPLFFIRGVGNTSAGTGEEGANAVYVDGVYIADMKTSQLRFNNIERIEVLKGPQGTLFGRNSSGGLINIITRDPGQELEAKVKVGYANYETFSSQAYLAGPLTETLSADVAFASTDQKDGWGKHIGTGDEVRTGWDWAVRSKWVWLPSDAMKFSLAVGYSKQSEDFFSTFRPTPGSVIFGGIAAPRDPYDSFASDRQFNDQRNRDATLLAEIDLGWATLTNIAAYRDNENVSSLDTDTGPLPLVHNDVYSSTNTFQEELRLSSNETEPLSWQAGIFLFRSVAELDPMTFLGSLFRGADYHVNSELETTSYAAFGEATYAITPSTRITMGARYTRDTRELEAEQVFVNLPLPTRSRSDEVTDSKPTWRLAVRHDVSEFVNVYASYNRGFKAGTYSMSSIFDDPVEPQVIDAFEIGVKSELLDSRLRLNAAAFYYEVGDYQVRTATGEAATARLINAAEVEVEGFELEFEAIPMENLQLFGAFTWLNSEFAEFPSASHTFPTPPTGGATPCGVYTGTNVGGNVSCVLSATGNATPLAPDFAGNIGATYTVPVGAGNVRLSAMYSYNDGYYFELDNRLRQPAYGVLNASVAWQPNPHMAIELWGRNLEDETYYAQKVGSSLMDIGIAAAPRTYGIDFTYTY